MSGLAQSLATLKSRYDVIVVGSGYGGGISACRLARAGKSVAVLERGREFKTGEFPSRFPDVRSEMQVTGTRMRMGPETALYDVRLGDDMHVLVGCGLGGGSLINASVSLRPDRRVFDDPIWPAPIRHDGTLEQGYQRAARWLRPMPDPGAAERTKFRALAHASHAVDGRMVAAPVAVSFHDTINPAGIHQPACTRCGDCCGGCNVGAKNTIAMTYLPEAKRHGAEIFTHAKVRRVEKSKEGGWRVIVGNSGPPSAEIVITAAVVILAAGTLGTTEILLRSREHGLQLSDCVGRRFSANGDIVAFGYGAKIPINAIGAGHPKKIVDLDVGATVSGQIEIVDRDDLTRSMTIQEGVMPSALAPVLPVLFVPNGRLLGALQSLISGIYKGPFQHLQTFFAVSHDSAGGAFRLDGDRLALSWPGAKEEAVYGRLDETLTKLVAAAGGSYVKNPLAGTVMGSQPATAHPLGGAVMGADRTSGVVNHKGQVFDSGSATGDASVHDGLYVIDGSTIPRSLGCNPLLTISALAERAMLYFGADQGFTVSD
jgi:cholesterol oxidase